MTKLACGCIPDNSGYGYCGECTRKLRTKIWRNMSKEKKDYDRMMDPNGSRELDELCEPDREGCSCHIHPPCSYCVNKSEDDE